MRKRKEASENLEAKESRKDDETNMKKLEKSILRFSDKFKQARLKILGNKNFAENQFWAPFNAFSALGMLLLGSKGTTKSQIQDIAFLHMEQNRKL